MKHVLFSWGYGRGLFIPFSLTSRLRLLHSDLHKAIACEHIFQIVPATQTNAPFSSLYANESDIRIVSRSRRRILRTSRAKSSIQYVARTPVQMISQPTKLPMQDVASSSQTPPVESPVSPTPKSLGAKDLPMEPQLPRQIRLALSCEHSLAPPRTPSHLPIKIAMTPADRKRLAEDANSDIIKKKSRLDE